MEWAGLLRGGPALLFYPSARSAILRPPGPHVSFDLPAAMPIVLILLAMALAGCAGTRQIETAPPQPARTSGRGVGVAGPMALFSIDFTVGDSALPADVRALRFRVEQIRLKQGSEWQMYPADVNSFEIANTRRGATGRKTVFSSRIAPLPVDSIGLILGDVFVLYDANAGGPLTSSPETPILASGVAPTAEVPARVTFTFEPGASLLRDPNCRWFFLPFWTLATDPAR